jgi:hypothetical protein
MFLRLRHEELEAYYCDMVESSYMDCKNRFLSLCMVKYCRPAHHRPIASYVGFGGEKGRLTPSVSVPVCQVYQVCMWWVVGMANVDSRD